MEKSKLNLEKLTDDFLSQFAFKKSSNKPSSQVKASHDLLLINNKAIRTKRDENDNLANTAKQFKKDNNTNRFQGLKIQLNSNNQKQLTKEARRMIPEKAPAEDPRFTVKKLKNTENLKEEAKEPKRKRFMRKYKKKKSRYGSNEADLEGDIGVEYDPELYKVNEGDIKMPDFAREPKIRDKNGRSPQDPGYDPTTLYVPEKQMKKFGPIMRKFWQVKQDNFDKLVFIRHHEVYFVYYNDAFICHKELGCNLFGFGIVFLSPTKLADYSRPLLEKGYQIIIVEPTESYQSKDDVKHEIYQILTRGTFIEPKLDDYQPRYCFCLIEKEGRIGYSYFDTTVHKFYCGELTDSLAKTELRSLLLRVKPLEIVYKKDLIKEETLALIKGLYWKPQLTLYAHPLRFDISNMIHRVKKHFNQNGNHQAEARKIPELLKTIFNICESGQQKEENEEKEFNIPYYLTLGGLYFSMEYLNALYLAETIIPKSSYYLHDLKTEKAEDMLLDGKAIQNLELLDVSYLNEKDSMSLFSFMDKTVSMFGRRLLRKWIVQPLQDPNRINERLDAVDDLINNPDLVQQLRTSLKSLPDIERMVHLIYNFGQKTIITLSDYTVYFKNKAVTFLQLLKILKDAEEIISLFEPYRSSFNSKRLKKLTTFQSGPEENNIDIETSIEGIFPKISPIIDKIESKLTISEGIPVPRPGVDKEFDKLSAKKEDIKHQLDEYLESYKKRFKCESLCYTHTRQKYEVEIPESFLEGDKKPKEFTIVSKRKGFLRFHTPEIESLIEDLHQIDLQSQKVVVPFLVSCFKEFYTHNPAWLQLISCLAELDCLASLSQVATLMTPSCQPVLIPQEEGSKFELLGMVHPCLASQRSDFVPNDVILESGKEIFLITGPNMGGKSTLMRGVCIATIMAQMGSYVPAEKFTLTPRDQIFTRIGAQDSIFEGKSTFFIELEETLNIINNATEHSLVIIDELGRGTSTYDGVALAYAVLKHISEELCCMTLFATHYHLLLEECRLYQNIEFYYMESEFIDEHNVKLLYKFTKGAISKSFGLNVAKMAGIPEKVIDRAAGKAAHAGHEISVLKKFEEVSLNFNTILASLDSLGDDFESIIPYLSEISQDTE